MLSPRSSRCMYSASASSSRLGGEGPGGTDGVTARSSSVLRRGCRGGRRCGPGAGGGNGRAAPGPACSPRSLALVQSAAQGLHAALDQACRGGGTAAEVLGDVGQRPALQVAQA